MADAEKLSAIFEEMEVKPNVDSKEAFTQWLLDFANKGAKPKDVKVEGQGAIGGDIGGGKHDHIPHTFHQRPRISNFYGSADKKDQVTYEQWKYEVECLEEDHIYSNEELALSVRQSLKGEAAGVARRLGRQSTIKHIIAKMDSVFGIVESKESLLEKFYSATQGATEDVSAWGCRLEELLDRAKQKGEVQPESMGEMLRSKFWSGLRQSLREIAGHKFDTLKDFDSLRVALRQIEHDQTEEAEKKPATAKMAVQPKDKDMEEITDLKAMINQLSADFKTWKWKGDKVTQKGHGNKEFKNQYGNSYQAPKEGGGQQGDKKDIICWRCGQVGHVKMGCRVILDHSKKSLNGSPPTGKGQQ